MIPISAHIMGQYEGKKKKPRPRVPSWFTKRAFSKWIGIDVSECVPLCSMDAKSFMNSTIRIHARRIAYDSIAATAVAVDIIYYLNPKTKVVHFTYVRLEACAVEQCRWNRQKEKKQTQSVTEWVFSCHSHLKMVRIAFFNRFIIWAIRSYRLRMCHNSRKQLITFDRVLLVSFRYHCRPKIIHLATVMRGKVLVHIPPMLVSSTIYVAIEWDQ